MTPFHCLGLFDKKGGKGKGGFLLAVCSLKFQLALGKKMEAGFFHPEDEGNLLCCLADSCISQVVNKFAAMVFK